MSSQDFTEYSVKLGDLDGKDYNIMRFKHPHRVELDKLTNPRLERQELKQREEPPPDPKTEGDGSEYRQKEREEARKRKRGYRPRKINPSDQPWILKDQGEKHYVGRKEGGINSNATYYILSHGANNCFEAYPISYWYNFAPPVKYNHLNDEEAEERFEKRHKTLNYFSIMVSKRIKEKDEEEMEGPTSSKQLKDSGSDDEFSSVGSDTESKEHSKVKKKKFTKGTKKKRKSSAVKNDDSEAGEETDEGDFESKEIDFYLTSSSEGEEELKAVQEEPRDDAEVERKEETGIDKVFAEESSSSSDEGGKLTESGKQLKALIRRHTVDEKEESEEEKEKEEGEEEEEMEAKDSETPPTKSNKKREAESPSLPSSKKQKLTTPTTPPEPTGPSHITKEEVCKYLSRKPVTAKALVKKFVKRKPQMTKHQITTRLAEIMTSLPTEKHDKKLFLPNYNNQDKFEEQEDEEED